MPKSKKYSDTIQTISALVLICIMIIPMLLLACYVTPSDDDFTMGLQLKLSEKRDVASILNVAWNTAVNHYYKWGGSFAYIFLETISPFVLFGLTGLKIYHVCLVATFWALIFYACRTVLNKYFKIKKWTVTLWAYALLMFLCTQFFNFNEILYWYVGSSYIWGFCFYITAIALFINAYYSTGKKFAAYLILSYICLAIGANGLIGAALLCVLFLFLFIRARTLRVDRRQTTIILCAFLICLIFAVITVAAPGNYIRKNVISYGNNISLIKILFISLKQAVNGYIIMLPLVFILGTGFLLAFFIAPYLKNQPGRFKHPVIICACAAIMFYATFLPVTAGYNGISQWPTRLWATAGLNGIGLTFFCFIYLFGYFVNNTNLINNLEIYRNTALMAAVLAFTVGITQKPLADWTAVDILDNFAANRIQSHHKEIVELLNTLENSKGEDVVLKPLKNSSHLLFPPHITTNSNTWPNTSYSKFYGNNSVMMEEEKKENNEEAEE